MFDECNSTCQSRFRIDGATLELTEVREEDRGLQLQCQILPTFQVYTMKISIVLPKGQSNLHHRLQVNTFKGEIFLLLLLLFFFGGVGFISEGKKLGQIRIEKVYK